MQKIIHLWIDVNWRCQAVVFKQQVKHTHKQTSAFLMTVEFCCSCITFFAAKEIWQRFIQTLLTVSKVLEKSNQFTYEIIFTYNIILHIKGQKWLFFDVKSSSSFNFTIKSILIATPLLLLVCCIRLLSFCLVYLNLPLVENVLKKQHYVVARISEFFITKYLYLKEILEQVKRRSEFRGCKPTNISLPAQKTVRAFDSIIESIPQCCLKTGLWITYYVVYSICE